MKIEEGKYYRNGLGNVVGPMTPFDSTVYPWRGDTIWKIERTSNESFTADGRISVYQKALSDLIEEVVTFGPAGKSPTSEEPTLRDRFAMAALGQVYIDSFEPDRAARIAATAYEIADAMMAERNKGEAK